MATVAPDALAAAPRRSVTARLTTLPLLAFQLLPVAGYLLGGGGWHWLTVGVLALMVALDPIVGRDEVDNPPEADAVLTRRRYYRVMLWLTVPGAFLVTLFGYSLITATPLAPFVALGVDYHPLAPGEQLGLALSVVLAVGFGAVVAHELCHHPQPIDRLLGQAQLTPIAMTDFSIYHNYHHHLMVATPEDHATAPYGENFWRFAARSIWRKSVEAWRVEARRLAREGRPPWWPGNRMLWLTAAPAAWLGLLVHLFGAVALPLFVAQYLFPRMLLATADFAEHYGLARRRLDDGSYEPVRPEHAWDDNHIVSSLMFCQIDRHADHHANVGRPYQVLRVRREAPRLPWGYLVRLWVVMVPPLWRRVMHPIVERFYRQADVLPYALPGRLPPDLEARAVIAAH